MVSKSEIEKEFLHTFMSKGALILANDVNNLFKLKSGRMSPYFVSIRALTDGESLSKMKWALAHFINLLVQEKKIEDFDFIFGPAYGAINLAALACEGLYEFYGLSKRYLYDRKEEKDYGYKDAESIIVGAGHFKPGQKILIVDDLITTGETKIESLKKLEILGDHKIVGLVLLIDRQEKLGDAIKVENTSAVDNLKDHFGIKVYSILGMGTIFNLVKDTLSEEIKNNWIDYYKRYGVIQLS